MRLGFGMINPCLEALCEQLGIKNYYVKLILAYIVALFALCLLVGIGAIYIISALIIGVGSICWYLGEMMFVRYPWIMFLLLLFILIDTFDLLDYFKLILSS